MKLDIFLHPKTPIGEYRQSKVLSNDFKNEDWSYKDNFVPKSFWQLAEDNKQIFNQNQKILKFEWQKEKTRLGETIQNFFFGKNYEILSLENFCAKYIFEGLSKV